MLEPLEIVNRILYPRSAQYFVDSLIPDRARPLIANLLAITWRENIVIGGRDIFSVLLENG